MLSISRKIASKCGLTASPSGESRTGGPRSNKGRPSSCSNRRIAVESDGWEMLQIAAARVNPPTWHTARKRLSRSKRRGSACGRSPFVPGETLFGTPRQLLMTISSAWPQDRRSCYVANANKRHSRNRSRRPCASDRSLTDFIHKARGLCLM